MEPGSIPGVGTKLLPALHLSLDRQGKASGLDSSRVLRSLAQRKSSGLRNQLSVVRIGQDRPKGINMYEVNYKNDNGIDCREEFINLDLAIKRSKVIGRFVTISFYGNELVGKFGVDSVELGQLPNGDSYTWKKRR